MPKIIEITCPLLEVETGELRRRGGRNWNCSEPIKLRLAKLTVHHSPVFAFDARLCQEGKLNLLVEAQRILVHTAAQQTHPAVERATQTPRGRPL